ncbi:modification methylase, HemK family [Candidatus Vecturithrix granuli]|uniref:Release factor glutamine methyltransferase n=1 Tax=Vecturithrix granuli TaxID=1499967 RepID=A0A081C092_VECG1|nr:modification methylase, HemK family [Candidatus Vecturithrix granuli]
MNQHQEKQWTILEILQWTTTYFQEKGVQSPRLTAELLLAHTLQQERMYLYVHYDQPLEPEERKQFKTLILRRIQGTPTQYLTGVQEFWSLAFRVTPAVLIPRPETEHLVELAVELGRSFSQPAILDLGTGSGAIAISLKHELPHANIYASDVSEAALTIARENAQSLLPAGRQMTFFQGDLFAPFPEMTFDLIVSNPPYISELEYAALTCEVRDHEPKLALYAGKDGLDVYRRLIAGAAAHLNPHGVVLVEIGCGQQDAVVQLFEQQHFSIERIVKDYAGIARVIAARKSSSK